MILKQQLCEAFLNKKPIGVITSIVIAAPLTLWILNSGSPEVESTLATAEHSESVPNVMPPSSVIATPDIANSGIAPMPEALFDVAEILADELSDQSIEVFNDALDETAETFSEVRAFDNEAINERMLDDNDFSQTVIELVRSELAQPRDQIGQNFVGIESDEIQHARRVLDAVQSFEEKGIAVDLDELSYVRLDDDVSAGIFGDSKSFEGIVSRRDDNGNEHLAMMVTPNETGNDTLSIRAPVSTGFSVDVVDSIRSPYWTNSSNGRVKGHWVKYRDFGEQDSGADYYAYERWGEAEPTSSFGWKRHVSTADLKSGIVDSSRSKIYAKLDYEPYYKQAASSGSCDQTTFGLGIGAVSLSKKLTVCDTLEPRYVWGGLHTRYEAQKTFKEGLLGTWGDHYDRPIRNNFLVSVSVKPGTVPYWWDYTDGYFCTDYFTCSEPSQ